MLASLVQPALFVLAASAVCFALGWLIQRRQQVREIEDQEYEWRRKLVLATRKIQGVVLSLSEDISDVRELRQRLETHQSETKQLIEQLHATQQEVARFESGLAEHGDRVEEMIERALEPQASHSSGGNGEPGDGEEHVVDEFVAELTRHGREIRGLVTDLSNQSGEASRLNDEMASLQAAASGLRSRMDEQEAEIRMRDKEVDSFKELLESRAAELHASREEIDRLKQHGAAATTALQQVRDQLDDLRPEAEALEQEARDARQLYQDLEQRAKEAKSEHAARLEEAENAREDLAREAARIRAELEAENAGSQTELGELRELYRVLEEDAAAKEQEIQSSREQLAGVRQALAEREVSLEGAQDELAELKTEREETFDELQKIRANFEDLRDQTMSRSHELERVHAELSERSGEAEANRNMAEELEEEKDAAIREAQALRTTITERDQSVETYRADVERQERELAESREEGESMQREHEELRQEVFDRDSRLEQVGAELTDLRSRYEELQQGLEASELERDREKREAAERVELLSETLESTRNRAEEFEREWVSVGEEAKALQTGLAQREEELSSTRSHAEDLEQELHGASAENERLSSEVDERDGLLAQSDSEIADGRRRMEELEGKFQASETDRERIERESGAHIEELNVSVRSARDRIEEVGCERDDARREVARLEEVGVEQSSRIETLSKKKTELESHVSQLGSTLEQTTVMLQTLEGERDMLRARLHRHGERVAGASQEIERLQVEIDEESRELQAKAGKLMDLMRALEDVGEDEDQADNPSEGAESESSATDLLSQ
ncbi:MAG: hypothetical protein O7B99_03090 [Planctomycetota bacterium]|nr:hypothetical protein [Planctomycetota bacterium]